MVPQVSNETVPRASAITAEDAIINFNTMTAEDIVRRHRAISHQVSKSSPLKMGPHFNISDTEIAGDVFEDGKDSTTALTTYLNLVYSPFPS